jgi:membrane protein implicated in regulation of membrane protease activity
MTDWGWWIVAAALLGAGELHTGGFFLAPFAVGAVAATIGALAGTAAGLQLAIFLFASLATFVLVRPVARRHLTTPPQIRTGTAALVGVRAQVLETVDVNGGAVRLNGEVWSARPYDEDERIEAGKQVHVMEIRGATALVSE